MSKLSRVLVIFTYTLIIFSIIIGVVLGVNLDNYKHINNNKFSDEDNELTQILEDKFEDLLQEFIKKNYIYSDKESFNLSLDEISQLSWLKDNNYQTTELLFLNKHDSIPVEIIRVLTRLYCLHLLRMQRQSDYYDFIYPQVKNNDREHSLSYRSFKFIANHITNLSEEEYQALRIATIISSLTKSSTSYKKAKELFKSESIPEDSIDFLSFTINKNMEMYPLLQSFIKEHPDLKSLFKVTFSSNMHLRHMIFSEGGIGMFKYLQDKIKYHDLTKKELNFWYCFWLINIAGFHGHIEPKGSIMLNENLFQTIRVLKFHIDQIFNEPNYNPLIPYLLYKANLLGYDKMDLNLEKVLVLSQLTSMLRIFDEEKAKQILINFESLPYDIKSSTIKEISTMLEDYNELAPSYAPALFANLYEYSKGDLSLAFNIFLPIYTDSLKNFRILLNENKINPSIRLSFYNLSKPQNIKKIFIMKQHNKQIRVNIDNLGGVLLMENK